MWWLLIPSSDWVNHWPHLRFQAINFCCTFFLPFSLSVKLQIPGLLDHKDCKTSLSLNSKWSWIRSATATVDFIGFFSCDTIPRFLFLHQKKSWNLTNYQMIKKSWKTHIGKPTSWWFSFLKFWLVISYLFLSHVLSCYWGFYTCTGVSILSLCIEKQKHLGFIKVVLLEGKDEEKRSWKRRKQKQVYKIENPGKRTTEWSNIKRGVLHSLSQSTHRHLFAT
jgi:hypothetical protein